MGADIDPDPVSNLTVQGFRSHSAERKTLYRQLATLFAASLPIFGKTLHVPESDTVIVVEAVHETLIPEWHIYFGERRP